MPLTANPIPLSSTRQEDILREIKALLNEQGPVAVNFALGTAPEVITAVYTELLPALNVGLVSFPTDQVDDNTKKIYAQVSNLSPRGAQNYIHDDLVAIESKVKHGGMRKRDLSWTYAGTLIRQGSAALNPNLDAAAERIRANWHLADKDLLLRLAELAKTGGNDLFAQPSAYSVFKILSIAYTKLPKAERAAFEQEHLLPFIRSLGSPQAMDDFLASVKNEDSQIGILRAKVDALGFLDSIAEASSYTHYLLMQALAEQKGHELQEALADPQRENDPLRLLYEGLITKTKGLIRQVTQVHTPESQEVKEEIKVSGVVPPYQDPSSLEAHPSPSQPPVQPAEGFVSTSEAGVSNEAIVVYGWDKDDVLVDGTGKPINTKAHHDIFSAIKKDPNRFYLVATSGGAGSLQADATLKQGFLSQVLENEPGIHACTGDSDRETSRMFQRVANVEEKDLGILGQLMGTGNFALREEEGKRQIVLFSPVVLNENVVEKKILEPLPDGMREAMDKGEVPNIPQGVIYFEKDAEGKLLYSVLAPDRKTSILRQELPIEIEGDLSPETLEAHYSEILEITAQRDHAYNYRVRSPKYEYLLEDPYLIINFPGKDGSTLQVVLDVEKFFQTKELHGSYLGRNKVFIVLGTMAQLGLAFVPNEEMRQLGILDVLAPESYQRVSPKRVMFFDDDTEVVAVMRFAGLQAYLADSPEAREYYASKKRGQRAAKPVPEELKKAETDPLLLNLIPYLRESEYLVLKEIKDPLVRAKMVEIFLELQIQRENLQIVNSYLDPIAQSFGYDNYAHMHAVVAVFGEAATYTHQRPLIISDVDGTLILNDGDFNHNLIEAWLEKGYLDIVLFTSMDIGTREQKDRERLVDHLKAKGFRVIAVATPVDGFWGERKLVTEFWQEPSKIAGRSLGEAGTNAEVIATLQREEYANLRQGDRAIPGLAYKEGKKLGETLEALHGLQVLITPHQKPEFIRYEFSFPDGLRVSGELFLSGVLGGEVEFPLTSEQYQSLREIIVRKNLDELSSNIRSIDSVNRKQYSLEKQEKAEKMNPEEVEPNKIYYRVDGEDLYYTLLDSRNGNIIEGRLPKGLEADEDLLKNRICEDVAAQHGLLLHEYSENKGTMYEAIIRHLPPFVSAVIFADDAKIQLENGESAHKRVQAAHFQEKGLPPLVLMHNAGKTALPKEEYAEMLEAIPASEVDLNASRKENKAESSSPGSSPAREAQPQASVFSSMFGSFWRPASSTSAPTASTMSRREEKEEDKSSRKGPGSPGGSH